MSGQNVEAFERTIDAVNRSDIEAALQSVDAEVEARLVVEVLFGGQATVRRGRQEIRETFRATTQAFAELHYEFSEIHDLGDRVVAIGRVRTRGRASGAVTESPIAYLVDFDNGRMTRLESYLDPGAALEAAGLRD
jgi:ketosteroid isomerase-like protein